MDITWCYKIQSNGGKKLDLLSITTSRKWLNDICMHRTFKTPRRWKVWAFGKRYNGENCFWRFLASLLIDPLQKNCALPKLSTWCSWWFFFVLVCKLEKHGVYYLSWKGLQRVECYVFCTLNIQCNLATLLVWMSDPSTLASWSSSISARLSNTPCAVEPVWLRKLGVSLVNGRQNLLPTVKEMLPGTFIAMLHCRWNPRLVLEFKFWLRCVQCTDLSLNNFSFIILDRHIRHIPIFKEVIKGVTLNQLVVLWLGAFEP